MNYRSAHTANASHRDKGGRNHLWLSVLLLLALTLGTIFAQSSATFAQEEGAWSGIVTDESGNPLPALVSINGVAVQTGDDGRFELATPAGENNRHIINATLIGYATISRIHIGSPLQEMRLAMKEMQRFEIQPDQDINVEDERGTQISIPAGGLIRVADGTPAKETVILYLRTYDLRNEPMVGDMTGITADGESGVLTSVGAFEAEFRDEKGELYNLAPDVWAKISVPVPAETEAPDWMPLWYYNPEKGVWLEEGQAVREGERYYGEVSHFTAWNFDTWLPQGACIRLTIDPAYLAANGGMVDVKLESLSPPYVAIGTLTDPVNVLWNLPVNVTVNLYTPPSAPTPFATVNTGAAAVPSYPYTACNAAANIRGIADLGDAPDSTNNSGAKMSTYPTSVMARFPTIFLDPIDPGPYHQLASAVAWFGKRVTEEGEAEPPAWDMDAPDNNIDPLMPYDDRDQADDGIHLPLTLPQCGFTTIDYDVHAPTGPINNWLLNIWFDFDRDGDWEDIHQCVDQAGNTILVPEWAVQDEVVNAPAGYTTLTTVAFAAMNPATLKDPMWMRATFTTQNAPPSPFTGIPAGGGPAIGYMGGETEDYYLTTSIAPPQPDLKVAKTANPMTFQSGDHGEYQLTVVNSGAGSALAPIDLYDTLPAGVTFVSVNAPAPWSCSFTAPTLHCTHPGPLAPGATATITVKVMVAPSAVPTVQNCVDVTTPNESDVTNNQACISTPVLPPPDADLGDAPGPNPLGASMLAYPGVVANFPVVYNNPGATALGPIHWVPKKDAWLGKDVSGEKDAHLLPDADLLTNIDPTANLANRDRFDDGIRSGTLNLPNCATTTFQYDLSVVGAKKTRYVNVWFDFNRNGKWGETLKCKDKDGRNRTVKEWAIVNRASSLSPRATPYTLTTPAFWSVNPPTAGNPLWMRITLSEGKAVTTQVDGRGPSGGYQYGETEDYVLTGPFVMAATMGAEAIEWSTMTDAEVEAMTTTTDAIDDSQIDTEADALAEVQDEERVMDKRVYLPLLSK